MIIDTEFSEDTKVGPGIIGEIEVKTDSVISYSAAILLSVRDHLMGWWNGILDPSEGWLNTDSPPVPASMAGDRRPRWP